MANYRIKNNVNVILSQDINSNDTTIIINEPIGGYEAPPSIDDIETGILTIIDKSRDPSKIEIIHYSDIVNNEDGTLTITGVERGKEDTEPQEFSSGAVILQTLTKDVLKNVGGSGTSRFLSKNKSYNGITSIELLKESVSFGDVLYYDIEAGGYKKALFNYDYIDEEPAEVMALENKSENSECFVLHYGYARNDEWNFEISWDKNFLYLSDSEPGLITQTSTYEISAAVPPPPPIVKETEVGICGIAVKSNIIKFNPSNHLVYNTSYKVTTEVLSGDGEIEPDRDAIYANFVSVKSGNSKEFAFYPDAYYSVDDVILDNKTSLSLDTSGNTAIRSYTIENIEDDHKLSAVYDKNWYEGYSHRSLLNINNNVIPEDDSSLTDFIVYVDLNTLAMSGDVYSYQEVSQSELATGTLDYIRSKPDGLKLVDMSLIIETLERGLREENYIELRGNLKSMEGYSVVDVNFRYYYEFEPSNVMSTSYMEKTSTGEFEYALGVDEQKGWYYRAGVSDRHGHYYYGRWEYLPPFSYDYAMSSETEVLTGSKRYIIIPYGPVEEEESAMSSETIMLSGGGLRTVIQDLGSVETESAMSSETIMLSGRKR